VELEDAIHIAILTLKEGFEGKMTEDNVEVSVLGKDGGFKVGGMTCLCVPRLLPAFFLCGFLGLFAHVARCRCCQKRKCWITFLRWNNCPPSINSQDTPLNFPAVISAIITRTHCIQMHEPFSRKRLLTHWLATGERGHCAQIFAF